MLFQGAITIPANTTAAAPVSVVFPIDMGEVTKVMVRPRPGHASLGHCVILFQEHQIWPSVEGMDIHGDSFPIDWEEEYIVDQPPYDLKLVGWNDDDTYDHTFDVYVAMKEQQLVEQQGTLGRMLSKFLKAIGV